MTHKADYSVIATSYDAGRLLPGDTMQRWVDLICDRGRLGPRSLCMDLGCGTGRFTLPVRDASGAEMVGVDLSAEMLAQAKGKTEGIHWVQCNAQNLAFESERFQCVFMSMLIHHVDDIDQTVRECHRVLKPGGVCLVRTSAHEDMEIMPVYRFFPKAWEIDRDRLPAIGVIEDSMRRAGFSEVRHEKVRQKLVSSAEAYVDKMRLKSISVLTLLTDEEHTQGMRDMEEHFRSTGPRAALGEVAEETLTLVAAIR